MTDHTLSTPRLNRRSKGLFLLFMALFLVATTNAQNVPPIVSLNLPQSPINPGAIVKAKVVVKFAPGLHGYQNPPSKDYMIPVTVKSVTGAELKSVQYPEGTVEMVAGEMAAVYSDTIEIGIEITAPLSEGKKQIEVNVGYQQCNATMCFAPDSLAASGTLTVAHGKDFGTSPPPQATPQPPKQDPVKLPPVEAPVQEEPVPVAQDDPEPIVLEADPKQPESSGPAATSPKAPESSDGLTGLLNSALENSNWWAIVPLAMVGGLLLCLTPCVFPMIPVTVSYFSSQTADKRGARLAMGIAYALGIAATYGTVGGVAAASQGVVGELFTKQWFAFALAALLFALALSMFDVYEIRLPNFIQKQLKGRSGVVGALIMGALMGFAAAPCAGAFVAAVAVKVAVIGSIPLGVGMFGLMGLGMGLPFIVLASLTTGAKVLPKSGGWLKTVKAVLGLIVLGIAWQYLLQSFGFRAGESRTAAAWGVFYGGVALYLLLEKSDLTRAVSLIKGLAIAGFAYFVGTSVSSYGEITFREEFASKSSGQSQESQVSAAGIKWTPFSDETLAQAIASGKPIMIDGKADWCVQCREIEEGVFNTPDGLVALSGVNLLAIDWSTGVDPKYIESTKKRFNIVGLPHIVFMSPGGKDEFYVNQLHSVEELKKHLTRAGARF